MVRSIAANFALTQPAARRFLTLFALLAFFLQGFAVQTHLHHYTKPAAALVAVDNAPAPSKSIDPVDLGSCRLCQELVHAGVFVAPGGSALFTSLSFITAGLAPLSFFAGASASAFGWQSRAPPRH
jgi:hypothetical protein